MKIKIQENDMIASAENIKSEIQKLEDMQKELQSMLNSTSWDMRARKYMEGQVTDARRLNSELTLIMKRMSEMIKLTTDSIKNKDEELAKSFDIYSESVPNGFRSHSESFTNKGPWYDSKLSVGDVGWGYKNGWFDSALNIGLLSAFTSNFVGYDKSQNRYGILGSLGGTVSDGEFDIELGNDYFGFDIEGGGYLVGAEAEAGLYYDVDDNKGFLGAQADANLAKGEISAQLELLWFEIGVGLNGQVGVGAYANLEYENRQFEPEIGAAFGPGGGVKFQVGLKD